MHAATDQVAVSLVTDASAGVGSTGAISRPIDAVSTMTALSHSHALLATTVLGRLSETDTHSAIDQWWTKTDMLTLSFWNSTITAISGPLMSSIMVKALTKSSLLQQVVLEAGHHNGVDSKTELHGIRQAKRASESGHCCTLFTDAREH